MQPTQPAGRCNVDELTTLAGLITGAGVRLTVACAVAVTVVPLLVPVTVTVSVSVSPAFPVNEPVNVHAGLVAPGANTTPINVPHVLPARVARFPNTLSTSAVIVTGCNVLGFETCTVNLNVPPGATSVNGFATFVTAICGLAGVNVTVAFAVAVTVTPLFTPVAVTVSVCDAPALPANGPENEHVGLD